MVLYCTNWLLCSEHNFSRPFLSDYKMWTLLPLSCSVHMSKVSLILRSLSEYFTCPYHKACYANCPTLHPILETLEIWKSTISWSTNISSRRITDTHVFTCEGLENVKWKAKDLEESWGSPTSACRKELTTTGGFKIRNVTQISV